MPKRGAVALVATVFSVLLLFTFKPSDQTSLARGLPQVVGSPSPTGAPIALGPQPQATQRSNGGGTRPAGQTAAPNPTSAPAAGGKSGTFTGDPVDTFYGTVQIALVVQNGQIVDVQELKMPSDRQLSQQISQEAGPMLRDQVLQAQSANIMGVSGASFTSYGFYQSLLSALAKMS